jgi:hypothetical protein
LRKFLPYSPAPLLSSGSSENSLFYIFATKGILERALNFLSYLSGWKITHCELIHIKTEFCFPVRLLDMPAMKLLTILLATLVS